MIRGGISVIEGSIGSEPCDGGDAKKCCLNLDLPLYGEAQPVALPENYPLRLVAAILVSRGGLAFNVTGALIGPKLVLTAAHNIFQASSALIRPALDGPRNPFGINARAEKIHVPPGWTGASQPGLDFGVLELDSPIGDRLGWFSLRLWSSKELVGRNIHLVGYREDLDSGKKQRAQLGSITAAGDDTINYRIGQTSHGNSGSPLWFCEDPRRSPELVGVHGAQGLGARVNERMLAFIDSLR